MSLVALAGTMCLLSDRLEAQSAPQFLYAWGERGSGPGKLSSPAGIALDGHGFVYVADQYNYRVCKFTLAGDFVGEWGTRGSLDGQFRLPYGITVDKGDTVFVVDALASRVQVFTSDGAFVRGWGTEGTGDGMMRSPRDVEALEDGTVLVTDHDNARVLRFTRTGQFLGTFGAGTIRSPVGITVSGYGDVPISDEATPVDGVHVFKADGTIQWTFGAAGDQPGQFRGPGGLCVDRSGTVYIVDHGNSRVQAMSISGAFVTGWGAPGAGDGEFSSPLDIAVSPDGRLFVTDAGNARVQVFGFAPVDVARQTWGALKIRYR